MRFIANHLAGASVLAMLLATTAQADDYDAPPGWGAPIKEHYYGRFLFDRLEYDWTDENEEAMVWDFLGWYGGDFQRVYLKGEGVNVQGDGEDAEFESLDLLYSHLISGFWELQGGLGYQGGLGSGAPERGFAVLSLFGQMPYRFEVDTGLRVSDEGDVSADFEAEYELRLTQRTFLQPRTEITAAAQEVPEFGVGEGLNSVRVGLRLRYEFSRKFAPYIGGYWKKEYGDTADISRELGNEPEGTSVVAGVRMWF